ncbi:MAG: TetR/AcrR family transcriptional regulator [Terriglobia bacterium]
MPYPANHRVEVRGKIIQSARRLFNRHGFENASIQQIMAGTGLTSGGFYSYFKSKSDLDVEVLGCFFTDPEWKSCWEGVEGGLLRALSPAAARRVRGHFLGPSADTRFAFTTSPTNSSGCSCTIALRSRNNRMPSGKSREPISYRQEIRA